MSELTLPILLLAGVAAIAAALLAGALLLQRRRLLELERHCRELQQNLATLQQLQQQQQQAQQNELLAMGQRVLEADKLVRRFSARLDAIENHEPGKTQYGQLESLLSQSIGQEGAASAAETELLALLRQQQRRS